MLDGRWRQAVDRTTQPVGEALVRIRVSADVLTVFGLAMSVLTAFVVGSGHLVIGIVMLFATGLPDLFDGPVAKASGTASVRGAFFDSVADRIADAFLFGGIAWYLSSRSSRDDGPAALRRPRRHLSHLLRASEGGAGRPLGTRWPHGACRAVHPHRSVLRRRGSRRGSLRSGAVGVPGAAVVHGCRAFREDLEGGRRPRGGPRVEARSRALRTGRVSAGISEMSRRRMARWRDLRADSRWKAWREALAQRDENGERVSLSRRSEPLSRWRARREGGSPNRSGPTWRERRQERLRSGRDRAHVRARSHSRADGSDAVSDGISRDISGGI